LVTGEYLTECCREIAVASVAVETPACCEEPEEDSNSQPPSLAGDECDCCDVVFEESQHRETAPPTGDSEVSPTHLAPVAVSIAVSDVPLGTRLSSSPARLRAPPKRPLFLIFESFLS